MKTARISVFVVMAILLLVVSSEPRLPLLFHAYDVVSDNVLVGVGGSGVYQMPAIPIIESFREWDHYHAPSATLPPNRFWTWAKMNRPIGTPAGDCMPGTYTDRASMDLIFNNCDKPLIDAVVAAYPGGWHGIGNEPNHLPRLSPSDYAYQVRMYSDYIKSIDPAAKIMIGGLVVGTLAPDWDTWLDQSGLSSEIDLWDIHPYDVGWPDGKQAAINSINDIKSFREWLDTNGFRGTIVVGEFSDGNGKRPVSSLVDYIETICPWMLSQNNVAGMYWWGVAVSGMSNAGLFSASPYGRDTVTIVGDAYIAFCGRWWFVGGGSYDRDISRMRGSMRNPFISIEEAIASESVNGGDNLWIFPDTTYKLPPNVFLPMVKNEQ